MQSANILIVLQIKLKLKRYMFIFYLKRNVKVKGFNNVSGM